MGCNKSTKLHRSLQLCLSRKTKKIPPIHIPSSDIPANTTSRRLLSACRFPRTTSLDIDQAAAEHSRDHAATLSDVDRFLFDNFRSLYIHDREDCTCLSSSPGASSSHVNESLQTAAPSPFSESQSSNIVAIMLFSIDPYKDFRRSMLNMMQMHHGQGSQPLDWDFMKELLFYYLQLNDQSVHKHILKALADLTAETHKGSQAHRKEHWAGKSARDRKS